MLSAAGGKMDGSYYTPSMDWACMDVLSFALVLAAVARPHRLVRQCASVRSRVYFSNPDTIYKTTLMYSQLLHGSGTACLASSEASSAFSMQPA